MPDAIISKLANILKIEFTDIYNLMAFEDRSDRAAEIISKITAPGSIVNIIEKLEKDNQLAVISELKKIMDKTSFGAVIILLREKGNATVAELEEQGIISRAVPAAPGPEAALEEEEEFDLENIPSDLRYTLSLIKPDIKRKKYAITIDWLKRAGRGNPQNLAIIIKALPKKHWRGFMQPLSMQEQSSVREKLEEDIKGREILEYIEKQREAEQLAKGDPILIELLSYPQQEAPEGRERLVEAIEEGKNVYMILGERINIKNRFIHGFKASEAAEVILALSPERRVTFLDELKNANKTKAREIKFKLEQIMEMKTEGEIIREEIKAEPPSPKAQPAEKKLAQFMESPEESKKQPETPQELSVKMPEGLKDYAKTVWNRVVSLVKVELKNAKVVGTLHKQKMPQAILDHFANPKIGEFEDEISRFMKACDNKSRQGKISLYPADFGEEVTRRARRMIKTYAQTGNIEKAAEAFYKGEWKKH